MPGHIRKWPKIAEKKIKNPELTACQIVSDIKLNVEHDAHIHFASELSYLFGFVILSISGSKTKYLLPNGNEVQAFADIPPNYVTARKGQRMRILIHHNMYQVAGKRQILFLDFRNGNQTFRRLKSKQSRSGKNSFFELKMGRYFFDW